MEMKINNELIKLLRTQRAWSQDELASMAGLSLRTVQRIENNGTCSLESKRALASVFEIEAGALDLDEQAIATSIANTRGRKLGYTGAVLGLACAWSAISYALVSDNMSWSEAGLSFGLTGALWGLCMALIGVVSNHQPRRE